MEKKRIFFKSIPSKRKIIGGILATIGYLLSPLSWWNDIILNLPLSYLFGSIFGLFEKKLFLPMFIVGYWLTNIAGFVLMHQGVVRVFKNENLEYSKRNLMKDIMFSIGYTIIVFILVKIGWVKFPFEYLK